MTEPKLQTKTEKPVDSNKLDHMMSTAPFLGIGKIEYNETYLDFEKMMEEQEKNLEWMDFFPMEKEIEKVLKVGAIVIVETKKYRALFNNKPGYESRKYRTGGDDHNSKFHTWQEVVNILKVWKDGKFNPNLIVEPNVHCINRNFRHVHIFKHKRGYLFANQFDMTYPHEIMNACIILGK